MKMLCKLLLALSVVQVAFPVSKMQLASTLKKLEMGIPIRVLLDESDLKTPFQWKLNSPVGFVLIAPDKNLKIVFQASVLVITYTKGSFYVNGQKQSSDHLFIIPVECPITYKKNLYDGVFALTQYRDTAYLVNHVELEEYVLSVLPYESWPAWPDEVQKAFCISFRSYGIAKVLEQRAAHEKHGEAVPYDIKNTTAHQLYKGRHKTDRFKRIVEDTKGIVIASKQKPILAMFDICCGGIIPSHKQGLNFSKAPYLARNYPCTYCKDYTFYTWSYQYSFDEVEQTLRKEFPTMGMLREIRISVRDQAGIAREIRFKAGSQWHTIGTTKFKALFKDLKSHCFTFERHGKSLTIKGRGHGHLVGLCQRGAHALVGQGWTYRNILKFYYPHTALMRLKKLEY